jgi:hypothetical protein
LTFLGNYVGSDMIPDSVRRSSLVPRLQAVLRPYTYPLWLDWPLQNHLTYGAPFDFDHYIEVAVTENGESSAADIIHIPDRNAGPGLATGRMRRLAWFVARLAADRDRGDILPLAIGGGFLKQLDASKVQIRSFRQQPLILGEEGGIDETAPPSADERLYAADIFFLPGLSQPQVNKIGEARDVAPVTTPSRSGGNSSNSSGNDRGAKATPNMSGKRPNLLLPGENLLAPPALPPALPPKQK